MAESTFLDVLLPDSLPNILRFFSVRPYNKLWKGHVRIQDVQYMYFGKGELSQKSQQVFTELSTLSLTSEQTRPGAIRLQTSSNYALNPLRNGLFEMMAFSGGASVKGINLEYLPKVLFAFQQSVGRSLILCTNLEEFAVEQRFENGNNLGELLKCLPADLASLAVQFQLDLPCTANSCVL